MRRIVTGIAVVVAALVILYVVLRTTSPGPERAGEPDTRCIAARIGLPCSS
jgi:hypothetical protein